jgi:hypothetical protein
MGKQLVNFITSFSGVIALLRHKYRIENVSASMLPPAKR